MKKVYAILLLFISVICCSIQVQSADRAQQSAELKGKVASAATAKDSIKALFDLYDVSTKKERIELGKEINALARRTGDTEVRIDILRLVSTNFEDERELNRIEKELETIPQSDTRDQAILFVKMRQLMYKARKMSEEQRQKEIVRLLNHYHSQKSGDKLQQILDLYTLVLYMRNDASGEMLKQYLERLIQMANSPEIKLNAIKNLVYSEATNIYSDAEDYQKAIDTNRTLLGVIENLEKDYKAKGRPYKNFDVSRYLIYRRMLRNAKALQPGEAQKYYDLALQLAESNSDIRTEMETNPRIHAYYYMATGDYNRAIPLLKDVVNRTNTLPSQKKFLEMLIEASEKTGDNDTRLMALTKYVSILTQLNELKAAEKSHELQISYDLRDLRERNEQLETENQQQEISSERSIMTLVSVAFIIILIVLVCMLVNWGRYRRNTSRMGQVVDNMHRERHRLRDTLYSDNYDIDPVASQERFDQLVWEKRMKQRKLQRGDATIFMTESIVNDLLYIAWVGHRNLLKHIVTTGADQVMRKAETNSAERLNPAVPLSIQYPEQDIPMETDADCLTTLFGHIFVVCTHFKPATEVTVECATHLDNYIDFIITLGGTAPASSEGVQIFRDMPISDILLNYENSGLYVCRMIALLLQCEIIPDKTYEKSARYILRVPKRVEV